MEKRYKEIDGVRYQVIQNTILGSNVIPVGESLPEVTTSDNGKLLGVSSGEWTPVDAPSGLPDITGNAGKVLKVNAGATGTEWANETTELPAVTAADEGDVLTVNASGEWEAAAPGGGGGGTTYYGPYQLNHNLNDGSITVTTGHSGTMNLDHFYIYDPNTEGYDEYVLPDDVDYYFIPLALNLPSDLCLETYSMPYKINDALGYGSIRVWNHGDSGVTLDTAEIYVLSSVELIPAQS